MELITAVKQWFQEDLSGRINNIINILILLAILSTCSTVSRVEQKVDSIRQQTGSLQPIADEELLKKRIVELLIRQLDHGKKYRHCEHQDHEGFDPHTGTLQHRILYDLIGVHTHTYCDRTKGNTI